MAYRAIEIANKILAKASGDDMGEPISNLKLQKMLYYMQGFHLAAFGSPLFDENIEAWMYGPAVPSIYEKYKEFGNNGIEYKDKVISLSPDEETLFNEVYKVYSEYSAIGLMNMTHCESPWTSTATGKGNVISHDKMKTFFKARLNNGQD